MFGFNKKEKEYKNKIEELENKIDEIDGQKWLLLLENCRIKHKNIVLEIQNERLEDFVDEIEEALKKLKGEE